MKLRRTSLYAAWGVRTIDAHTGPLWNIDVRGSAHTHTRVVQYSHYWLPGGSDYVPANCLPVPVFGNALSG